MKGSVNYLNAISDGMVEGDPKYANYEPHHKKNEGGSWVYINMYNEHRESELEKLMKNPESGFQVNNLFVMWSEQKGLRLIRNAGGVHEEIPFPNKGENYLMSDEPDVEDDEDFIYYSTSVWFEVF